MKNFTHYAALAMLAAALIVTGCETDDTAPDTGMLGDTTAMDTSAMDMDIGPMGQAEGDTLNAVLSGTEGAPEPGDPDGSGTAMVVLEPGEGRVCYEIEVENIEEPAAAHIHTGAAGTSGPPVVDFDVPNNGLSACVDADEATIQDILASPSQYYVNVHNAEFGGGAVRGQLGM